MATFFHDSAPKEMVRATLILASPVGEKLQFFPAANRRNAANFRPLTRQWPICSGIGPMEGKRQTEAMNHADVKYLYSC